MMGDFFCACKEGNLEKIKRFIEEGYDVNKKEKGSLGSTPLIYALSHGEGRFDVIKYLIERGADVSKKDCRERTALHYASESGHLKLVVLLLKEGAKIDVQDEVCHTPLMAAAKRGHHDVLSYLIERGADIHKRDRRGRTALHYTSDKGHLKVVELLFSKGADINVEDIKDHFTPLMLSARRKHYDILLYLLNHGADVNKKDSRKRTVLHSASDRGDLTVAKLLLSKGGNSEIDVKDEDCHTPLMLAAKKGHHNVLSCVINCGADVHKRDGCERTALHYASENGRLKVVKLLVDKGAQTDVEDRDHCTPLMLAARREHEDVLSYLIDQGGDINKKDGQGQTALHYASVRGHMKGVKLLLQVGKGAEIDTEDKDHCTPLILAIKYQTFDIICYLIKSGANVKQLADYLSGDRNFRNLGRKALSYAINYNHRVEASILITNGVGIEEELDINPPRTALMWSVENGHDSLVRNLILQGVEVDYQDTSGSTALHFAARSNRIQCGILLVEAGADVRLVNNTSLMPLDLGDKNFKDILIQTILFNVKKTVCVMGDAHSGKSTLIASLNNENARLLPKIRNRLFGVKKISQRTAGIEPVSLSSKRYGNTMFLDFAGQQEYHGPHEMFMESIINKSRCTVTIIVVVKVTDDESDISQQLDRWLYPVSEMASTRNSIRIIVIGSHADKVKFKDEAKKKLEQCYEKARQNLCDAPLQFHDACYLDCRQPYSSDIGKLCSYLNEVPIPEYQATKMPYSICWVVSHMKTSLDGKAIRVADFTEWIEENKANLPTNLPPAEEVCKDLSSTGHFLYFPNKEEPSNGWLILDLPSILHKVYGTLFSHSKKIVNKFGLLNCQELSDLFTTLDERMVRDVLIGLEFCIEPDSSILVENVNQLTQSTDEGREHLFFPALVSSRPPKVFTSSQPGYHTLSWQLLVNKKPFISPRLLQTIILRLAAHHVFHYKRGFDTREHYCSVWSTGIFWQSTKDVDVAVQITDSAVVEVIGKTAAGPEVLCSYISAITQDISATINELSPTLSATAYIIHPADPQVLLENPKSPSSQKMFPVEVILESTKNGTEFCLSCMVKNKPALRVSISKVFCGFEPSEKDVQRLCFVNEAYPKPAPFQMDMPSKPPTDPLETTPTQPLMATPTLNQLNRLIIRKIALDWFSVGLHLEIEVLTLQIVEANVYPPSVERCCHTMFTSWLSHDEGTGGAPRLWRTVLKALKNVGYNSLVGDVERTLFEQN